MPDKLLIAGLGNPGRRYEDTRHNIGFMVVDELAAREREVFRAGRGEYLYCRIKKSDREFVLQKPLTFMNLSGSAVRHLLDYYKFSIAELLVICDDINLPFGSMRFRADGSDGGHNGLASIIASLGSQGFCRLRIGVSREFAKGAQADYVLSPFAADEREELNKVINRAADAVLHFSVHGLTSAMNHYNQ